MNISRLLRKPFDNITGRRNDLARHKIDEAWIRSRQAEFEKRYPADFERDRANADLLVLSFPKAGRTWHRAIVGYYLARLVGEKPKSAFNLPLLCSKSGIKQIVYSHNGANFVDWLPPDHPLIASPSLWKGMPVTLLVREPKDILVSAYHHARYREALFDGTLSEFVREPRTGIAKIMIALNRWHENQYLAASFDVTSYERMHAEPEKEITKLLEKAGVEAIDQKLLSEAVHFCRFESMRKKESSKFFKTAIMHNRTPGDDRSRKVREGQVGGYKRYLTAEDEIFINDVCERMGNPFQSYLSA